MLKAQQLLTSDGGEEASALLTPLQNATIRSDVEGALSMASELVKIPDGGAIVQLPPLFFAIELGQLDLVKQLFKVVGEGWTAPMLAAVEEAILILDESKYFAFILALVRGGLTEEEGPAKALVLHYLGTLPGGLRFYNHPEDFKRLKEACSARLIGPISAPLEQIYSSENLATRLGQIGHDMQAGATRLDAPGLLPIPDCFRDGYDGSMHSKSDGAHQHSFSPFPIPPIHSIFPRAAPHTPNQSADIYEAYSLHFIACTSQALNLLFVQKLRTALEPFGDAVVEQGEAKVTITKGGEPVVAIELAPVKSITRMANKLRDPDDHALRQRCVANHPLTSCCHCRRATT